MIVANLPENHQAYEYTLTARFNTIVSEFGEKYSGFNEQARGLGEFPVFDLQLGLRRDMTGKSVMQTAWDHFMSARGRENRFYFFDYRVPMTHSGRLCAIGDGAITTIDLPGRNTSGQTVYAAGNAAVVNDYLVGSGVAGCDQAVLAIAPNPGEIVTADFYGYGCYYGRYDKDEMDRDSFFDFLFSGKLDVHGLPWPV